MPNVLWIQTVPPRENLKYIIGIQYIFNQNVRATQIFFEKFSIHLIPPPSPNSNYEWFFFVLQSYVYIWSIASVNWEKYMFENLVYSILDTYFKNIVTSGPYSKNKIILCRSMLPRKSASAYIYLLFISLIKKKKNQINFYLEQK